MAESCHIHPYKNREILPAKWAQTSVVTIL